ncbi:fused MFS/spermidine synthase [Steroidobacter sp. S1-65]|uniref:Fused MFS/spermidine synthase n=1 Tax=Steroidobacter gossypii TaxID=2805490 RepID=A0ABS1WVT4_9GAMM|nr:fused MFS/spermidine synthase [Steroidobacter gossypii]MBM0105087.1 fused MFS/spermidine synthase [Steroidobacter gossypii]
MRLALTYSIAGWSGFFVMAVELLGGRLLAPTFGSSIYVWGAIITVFMLALSIGYLAGGRLSMNGPSVRKLGIILIVAALTVLPLLLFAVPMLDSIAAAIPDPRWGSLVGATALFFIPTLFSGMISPYAVRLIVPDRSSSGRHAGQLYFVSTFGSAAGTLLTSFYLVLIMEVNHILIALMAISGSLGLAAILVRGEANAQ